MPNLLLKISFADLVTRETQALARIDDDLQRLEKMDAEPNRTLSKKDKADLEALKAIKAEIDASRNNNNKTDEMCDPLFVAARTLLNTQGGLAVEIRAHDDGVLLFGDIVSFRALQAAIIANAYPAGDITLVALTLGLLALDHANAPPVVVVGQDRNFTGSLAIGKPNGRTLYPDVTHAAFGDFTKSFFKALGEARSYGEFAERVLAILADEGDPDGRGGQTAQVRAEEFARVMRGLADRKIPSDEAQLSRRVNEVLNKVQGIGSEDEIADLSFDLPDLDQLVDNNIIADNVKVMGPMIVSAMFDELKVFQVVDRIVEQFQHGMLPIGSGPAGRLLYKYWREAPNRMSEQERKNFASITLGVPGGEPGGMINREFNDLWLRFVSSVSNFVRQNEVDNLLRSGSPSAISQQQVRKAARDLAGNLSLHGYGMAHYAGRELKSQIQVMIDLLGDAEIRGCYGARDMWQVVDQVATYELGGARTSSRYRTLATCGMIITAWLSQNVTKIGNPSEPIIDMSKVRFPNPGRDHKATSNPNDYDLVNACELWLADTATSDTQVDELSQPREAPQMTSKPIQIPAMAREMLDGIGDIGLGMGARNNSWSMSRH